MLRLLPRTGPSGTMLLALVLCAPLTACDSSSSPTDASPGGGGSPGGNDAAPDVKGTGGAPGNMDARGTGGTSPAPDGGMTIPRATPDPMRVAACTEERKVYCGKLAACAPSFLKITYGDLATCQAKAPLICQGEPAIPSSTVTAAMLSACNAAQATQSCEDYVNNADLPVCNFKGPKPLGASCLAGEQCDSGNCSAVDGDFCGQCTAFLAKGVICAAASTTTGRCAPGLVCNGRTCIALSRVGEACTATQLCGFGLNCVAGVCAAQLALGATCNPAMQECSDVAGLVCDPTTAKCIAATFNGLGGMCNNIVGCSAPTGCYVMNQNDTMGTCMPTPKEGDQCQDPNNPCSEPYFCLQASATTSVCGIPGVPDPKVCEK